MPTFSNEIIVAGQPYALGGDIQVINFRDNLDYSFIDPVGGQCAPGTEAPAGPAIPGMTVSPTPTGGGRRRFSSRRGLSTRAVEGMAHDELLNALSETIRQVVVHHDATYTSHSCFGVLCARGLSTHFMVNHDGGIIQGLDPVWAAYHAGDFNSTSIGVDMNNVATVEGHQQRYTDHAFGGVVDYETRELVEGLINRSRKTSFAYTEEQYISLCALLKLLHDLIGLALIFPQSDTGDVVHTRLTDPTNFIGFFGHWHCQAGKWDPGPGFDWQRVMEGLHGKANFWPIDLGVGRLRDMRSQQAVEEATTTIYQNIEEGPAGGGYPVGLNQEWHDGVHLYAEAGTPVHACSDGEIILTRNGPNLPLGSPNYVLMRHQIERELVEYDAQGVATVTTDTVWWYSLYMHLQRMDPVEIPDDRAPTEQVEGETEVEEEEVEEAREMPAWYQRLVRLARESKAEPLRPHEDYEIREVDENPRLFEERARGLLRLQEFRHAYQCIEDGNPFRWVTDPADPEQSGIEVRAGDIIGYVGEYGQLVGGRNGRIEKQPMIQFQVFSTVPVFDDTRFDADTWKRIQGDLSGNSLVSVPELVLPIQGGTAQDVEETGPRTDLGRGRVLTPTEIESFFRAGEVGARRGFRTVIAQHYSEWDLATDDSLTADVPVLWPWQTDDEFLFWRALHVGFKWLNDDTRDLLGMVEGPMPVYTYHPIYLLGWWALNYGRAVQGQTFEGLQGRELEEALAAEEESEQDRHFGDDEETYIVRLEDMETFRIRYPDLEDREDGEWGPDVEFLNPLDRRR